MARRLTLLSLLFSIVFIQNSYSGDRVYAPHHYSRPSQESVFVEAEARDFVRFWWNYGEGSTHLLAEFLRISSPEAIEQLEGFKAFKQTRITLYSYEIRSREVLDRLEELLERGMNVRVVVDGKNHKPLKMPSDAEWEKWSEDQQAYFVFGYDNREAPDGKVDEADLAAVNSQRFLAMEALKRLQSFRRKYKTQVDIVQSPNEVVPANEHFNYPRNHHFKGATIEYRPSARSQKWSEPVLFWTGSANFTDAGLDQKISSSHNNKQRYVSGQDYDKDPKSEGHLQFGAIFGEGFQSPEAMEALMGPIEKWTYAYRRGRHYDSVSIPEDLYPRVVFEDGSSLQAFFSEGQRLDGQRTIDPVKVVERILSRPDIEIKAYYDTQFVFTHHGHARHLRSVLNHHKPEKFFIAVDSSQALEDYSALPTLLFAPSINDTPGTFEGRALEKIPMMADELNWSENVMVYRGGIDLHQRENDKLHSKAKYFRYVDSRGEEFCVAYFGSGNATYNVSKLSSDAMFLFETSDQTICQELEAYFESLRSHHRMESFDSAYLERKVKQHFYLSKKMGTSRFYKRFAAFLHGGGQKRSLQAIVKDLKAAGPRDGRGTLILQWLEWQLKYRADLKEFDWVDMHLILRLSDTERSISEELRDEVFERWSEGMKDTRYARRRFNTILKALGELRDISKEKALEPTGDHLADAKARLLEDCTRFLRSVRADQYERQRHSVAKAKKRKKR